MSQISTNLVLEIDLQENILLKDVKALGALGDVFRFYVLEETNHKLVYFEKEYLTSNKDEALSDLKKEIDKRELFLVKVSRGIILTGEGEDLSKSTPKAYYFVFVQKTLTIELADIPY